MHLMTDVKYPIHPLTPVRPWYSVPRTTQPQGSLSTVPIECTCTGHLLCNQKSLAFWVLFGAHVLNEMLLSLLFFSLSPEKGFDRYKMVVQVVIGEQRGEGVK